MLLDFLKYTESDTLYLVLHGDEFDSVVKYAKWLAVLGDKAYERALDLNRLLNLVRRKLGLPYWSLSSHLKRRVKQAVQFVSNFEQAVVREANELELSINKYCLTKMLQPANSRFVPIETGARRGRRPGPQITLERVKINSDSPKPRKSRKRKSS